MKNLVEYSIFELDKNEMENTQGGSLWPLIRGIAALAYWTWDNWDELSEAAQAEVSNTYVQ